MALFTNLLQTNAYAISLLYHLMTGSGVLDFFHAGYALLLALSSMIPLTAIAPPADLPPWAITGDDDPQLLAASDRQQAMSILRRIEQAEGSDDDYDSHDELLLRKRRYKALMYAFEIKRDRATTRICGITASHLLLYLGFGFSLALWIASFLMGVMGGLSGSTSIKLAQPNCTASLGGATLLLYADIGFLVLAVVVAGATLLGPLISDTARGSLGSPSLS
ncbi:hypothetical protein OIO90_001264 [Microbotryomycetes sp. JL221]|nr:hypothetical protein OIO90_001264 [Microbotryomycetes sp. JL221]